MFLFSKLMRRRSLSWVIIRSAAPTSVSINDEIECMVLNKKCGCNWLFRACKWAFELCLKVGGAKLSILETLVVPQHVNAQQDRKIYIENIICHIVEKYTPQQSKPDRASLACRGIIDRVDQHPRYPMHNSKYDCTQ